MYSINTPISQMKSKHSNSEKNVSSFLLSQLNFPSAILKKNANNTKMDITFRIIAHFFLVGETQIITKKSPIFLESGYNETLSKSTFNFLLTGKDNSSLITLSDKKIIQAKNEAKIDVLNQLIDDLEKAMKEMNIDSDTLYKRIQALEKEINKATDEISESSNLLIQHQEIRKKEWEAKQEIDSHIISISELLKRFDLLRQHYESDLKRLDFISEGDYYFAQLEVVNCPVCGSPLSKHAAKNFCEDNEGQIISIQKACKEEARKIQIQLADLSNTINDLDNELKLQKVRSQEQGNIVNEQDEIINQILQPKMLSERNTLNQFLADKQSLLEYEMNKERLESLWVFRSSLSLKKENISMQTQAVKVSPFDTIATREFSNEVEKCLKEWKYIDENGRVDFNDITCDLLINGEERKSNGKGVRALIYSAFVISLMRYCKLKSLPHPSFVVLDSPLTTFKEKSNDPENEEVSGEIQDSFFENLSHTNDKQQIIIFDNKEPNMELRKLINFIQFTGENWGRRGFYP